MLPKYPKNPSGALFSTVFKGLFIAELGVFGVSYFFWHKLNIDQKYRHEMLVKRPWMLEFYYKTGELIGDDKIRRQDYLLWGIDWNPKQTAVQK